MRLNPGVGRLVNRRLGRRFNPTIQFPSLYQGQVATNCTIPSSRSTTNKQANSRTVHIARDTITSLKIELANWCWLRSGAGPETAGGGNITYSASIEYPLGVFTQVLFTGAATKVVASNASVLSDAVNVNIPNGATFWVRTYANAVTAIVFVEGNTGYEQRNLAAGEAYEYAASGITDKTMGGTIVDVGAVSAPIFRPTAIVAQTRRPSVLILGDSRDWGFTDTHDASGDLGDIARSLGPQFGYINAACAGDTFSALIAGGTKRFALQQYVSHVVVGDAINALRSGGSGQNKSAATVLGELQQILALVPSKRRIVTTCGGPQTTTSGNWTAVDGSDQTVNANNTEFLAYQAAIRAGVANCDGYFDVGLPLQNPSNAGKWWATGVANATTTDGLHSTQLGYLLIKSSGVVNPALITRAGL